MALLQEESRLDEIVQLVGVDALLPKDRMTLVTARSIRQDFLQQNAFDEVDTYTSREKQFYLLRNILFFYHEALRGIALGAYFKEIIQGTVSLRERLARSKYVPEAKLGELTQMEQEIKTTIQQIVEKGGME